MQLRAAAFPSLSCRQDLKLPKDELKPLPILFYHIGLMKIF